jgi:hypothetical protein
MADIVYRTVKFPVGFVGVPYEAAIGFTGAATPVTAAGVASGSLPTGLVVNQTDFVRITGTPTVEGSFTFALTMSDTAGASVSGPYTIVIVDTGEEPPEIASAADTIREEWPLN